MPRILIACALVCTVTLRVVQAEKAIELHLPNSVTLSSGDALYTLWKTNTSIHVNSTKENFKPCAIHVDPVKDSTVTRIKAKELQNHKFILWGYRSFASNRGIVRLNHTVLVVDPSSCSYKAVSIPEEKQSAKNLPVFHSRLVPFKDGFDFFYASHGKCSPCRFSLQGEPIPLEYQLDPEKEVFVPYGFNIEAVDETDTNKGYIYTLNFKNDTTSVIKYLDSNFEVSKELLLQHPIHSLSVKNNKEPIISICYASHNFMDEAFARNQNFKVHCEQFDSDLKSKFAVRLPVPDKHFVFGLTGITHHIDSSGNMFIGLSQFPSDGQPKTQQLRFFVIDKTGKIIGSRDYEKTNLERKRTWFEVHGYLLSNKEFCIVTDISSGIAIADTTETINCIDISKYMTSR